MTTSFSQFNNACQRAVQYLLAIIMVLIIGKSITLIPVMSRLQLADTFKAAEMVWFGAKLSALVMFFYFARSTIAAIPNSGGILSFFRNIAEPVTVLIIVILGQELLWQLLEPFVQEMGKTIYFSLAVILIVAVSIWLVFRAYQSAIYLFDASRVITKYLSRFIPNSNKICVSCGKPVTDNAMFCSHCGHEIEEQSNCSECGELLLADEKFCRSCGTEVKEKSDLSQQ